MLLGCFLGVATVCSLLAAPWRAPQHLMTVKETHLLVIAGVIQVPVLFFGQLTFGPLLSAVLVALWALRNRHLPGSAWLLIGVTANALAMAAHGGAMPLDPDVARQLGLSGGAQLLPGSKDVIGNHDLWRWIGDWIMLRLPGLLLVLSPGDLFIVAALLRWCAACHIEKLPRQLEAGKQVRLFKGGLTA